MTDPKPVFIADTCIGGLSVLKSLWESGCAGDALFMADYEVNPLGVKSDAAIADAVNKWFSLAKEQADTLILACNTLSIRYHQLPASRVASSGLQQIVSMKEDCLSPSRVTLYRKAGLAGLQEPISAAVSPVYDC